MEKIKKKKEKYVSPEVYEFTSAFISDAASCLSGACASTSCSAGPDFGYACTNGSLPGGCCSTGTGAPA
jgi:hypothetical protein